MFEYNLTTWLLLFFTYSFLGWVWESTYVSIKDKKLTNRGFMSGPFLPLYGTGAIIVLFTTLPVKDSKVGIYFVGAISATLLELVVGYFMELLFKVRYWDYSYKKIQYKGYICLTSTIAWGFFSILLVDYLNVPIENYISQFPISTLNTVAIIILIPFTIDMVRSIHNALDLKELLETMEANNKTVAKMVNYADEAHVKLEEDKYEFKEFIDNIKTTLKEDRNNTKIAKSIHKQTINYVENIIKQIENELLQDNLTDSDRESKENDLAEFKALDKKLVENEGSVEDIDFKEFKGAINLLKRNPDANHKTLKSELDKLNKISF